MLESPRALAPARTGFVYFTSSFVDGMMIALVELQLKNSCDSPFCVRGLSMTDDEPREKVLAQHCCCHESERAKSADFFWQRLSFSSRGMSGSARYPTCRGTFPEFLLPPALPHAPNCHPQPRASREIPPSHSRRREGINTHTHTHRLRDTASSRGNRASPVLLLSNQPRLPATSLGRSAGLGHRARGLLQLPVQQARRCCERELL